MSQLSCRSGDWCYSDEGIDAARKLPKLTSMEDPGVIHAVHHFSDRANWLVPRRILLGKYPGECPSDPAAVMESARERVRDVILRGDVTDLLCLQAEIPPQDDKERFDEGRNNRGALKWGFGSYRAQALSAAKARFEKGTEGSGNSDVAAAGNIKFHHFPIPDLSPADNLAALASLVNELVSLIEAGKVLYIHCWGGRGRTGLVASCLLGRLYSELDAEQALARVDAYFRTRSPIGKETLQNIGSSGMKGCRRLSPETEEQEEQVRHFYKHVLRR